jgi:glycine/D-amino acid oxidase-like deaminating enzyme
MASKFSRRGGLKLAAGATLASLARQAVAQNRSGALFDVAVIGAGVFGAWTAWHLVRSGMSVALFDQYGPANARASSAGESRVFRMGYGGSTIYSEMAAHSMPFWQDLSERCALPVFHRTGVLWFSPEDDEYMKLSLAWLRKNGKPHWYAGAAQLSARFPQMRFDDNEAGFVELDSGALIAGRAVQTVAKESGAQVITARIGPPNRLSDGNYRVTDEVTASNVVYACGPWLGNVFPELLQDRIVPTRQEVLHFGPAQGDTRFAPPSQPVWADFNNGEIVYGLPDLEGQGFKLAFDTHGPRIDPDTQDRRLSLETVEGARTYLARRFPALADAPLVHSRVCQYENTSNGDLLIDRIPGHDRAWLVGGGSGHGFKHGPAVGERVACHILDASAAVEPRFSLATKGQVAARSVY